MVETALWSRIYRAALLVSALTLLVLFAGCGGTWPDGEWDRKYNDCMHETGPGAVRNADFCSCQTDATEKNFQWQGASDDIKGFRHWLDTTNDVSRTDYANDAGECLNEFFSNH